MARRHRAVRRLNGSSPEENMLPRLNGVCTGTGRPNVASSTLRRLAHLGSPGTEQWPARLTQDTLAQGNPEMKDAGVQTVEHWANPGLDDVLKSHSEELP